MYLLWYAMLYTTIQHVCFIAILEFQAATRPKFNLLATIFMMQELSCTFFLSLSSPSSSSSSSSSPPCPP